MTPVFDGATTGDIRVLREAGLIPEDGKSSRLLRRLNRTTV